MKAFLGTFCAIILAVVVVVKFQAPLGEWKDELNSLDLEKSAALSVMDVPSYSPSYNAKENAAALSAFRSCNVKLIDLLQNKPYRQSLTAREKKLLEDCLWNRDLFEKYDREDEAKLKAQEKSATSTPTPTPPGEWMWRGKSALDK